MPARRMNIKMLYNRRMIFRKFPTNLSCIESFSISFLNHHKLCVFKIFAAGYVFFPKVITGGVKIGINKTLSAWLTSIDVKNMPHLTVSAFFSRSSPVDFLFRRQTFQRARWKRQTSTAHNLPSPKRTRESFFPQQQARTRIILS